MARAAAHDRLAARRRPEVEPGRAVDVGGRLSQVVEGDGVLGGHHLVGQVVRIQVVRGEVVRRQVVRGQVVRRQVVRGPLVPSQVAVRPVAIVVAVGEIGRLVTVRFTLVVLAGDAAVGPLVLEAVLGLRLAARTGLRPARPVVVQVGALASAAVCGLAAEEAQHQCPALVERGQHLLGRSQLLPDGEAVADDDL